MSSWDVPGQSTLAPPPPTGFKIASLVLSGLGGFLFLTGLFPCMGWLNWFGVPVNAAAALVGILGLTTGPKNPDGSRAYQGFYIAAIVVGAVGFLMGALRCLGGGGII